MYIWGKYFRPSSGWKFGIQNDGLATQKNVRKIDYVMKCKLYIGETSRNLPKRINEHENHFKSGNISNSLIIHNISTNHTFYFQHSNFIAFIHDKNKRRIIELSAISYYKTIQQRSGFYKISPYLFKMMLKDFNLYKQWYLNRYLYPPSS